ncbi:hydroperoxide isomerase ALOXE3-like [Scomber scombrus]|uniref:Hydroperoxide isomerase ALOXE3-like n=1 Tax=Scomber scombrus TaxID=13677 RepID=A0AAV1NUW4_SCOSC
MAEYKIEVTTGDTENAGTLDHIYVTLFGTEGQSKRTELGYLDIDFTTGAVTTYTMETSCCLGTLLLVKVEKDPHYILPEDEWYCSKIVVTTPDDDVILFPCYRWVSSGELVELRGGRAMKVYEEEHPLLIDHRKRERALKKSLYQWKIIDKGIPHFTSFNNSSELPAEIRFSKSKQHEMQNVAMMTDVALKLKRLIDSSEDWESFEEMKTIFCYKKTTMSEYVTQHWKEDDFYGSQFLNGINPNTIKRCSELPPNFPVTEDMVRPFLEEDSCLHTEMEDGNIFICDKAIMDGIPARNYNGEPLDVTAGFCLFYLNPDKKLMPIAIQLHQEPSRQNPIFLPSDPEPDWLLAKMFIKNADLMDHQAVHHLMKTHYLAEVLAVATLRSFPVIHPIYKLLIPHFRYTLPINTEGRKVLFGREGALRMSSLGYEGLTELMRRSLSELTYSSLCLPENITARGLESIPNFYYRDDGLKLWKIINRFVEEIMEHYYHSDCEVQDDSELQEWIHEIFMHGFLGNTDTGIPHCFHNVEEVIKFITMVIFTVTAQHTAVNDGQFDYSSWMPNGSLLLRQPPPTTKGEACMDTVLDTLPNVAETASIAGMLWLLSEKYTDVVPLGSYPEERFDEHDPKEMIKDFQDELSHLSEDITSRNSELKVPYTYLNPAEIENSITI